MATEVKLKESTTNDALAKLGLGVNKKDGVVTIPEGLYDETLTRDGLDPKVCRQYQEHRASFLANAAHTLGEPAIEAMVKNKDIQNISADIEIGHDKATFSFDRARVTNDGKGGQITQNGYMTVGYTARGAGASKGELKKVREHLKQVGLAKLGA